MRFRKWVGGEEEGYHFFCPGCERPHTIRTKGKTTWGVSGSGDLLTFTPSILVTYEAMDPKENRRCHSYVKEGRIQFLGDCTHSLKGQTVDIPDWPQNWKAGGAVDEEEEK